MRGRLQFFLSKLNRHSPKSEQKTSSNGIANLISEVSPYSSLTKFKSREGENTGKGRVRELARKKHQRVKILVTSANHVGRMLCFHIVCFSVCLFIRYLKKLHTDFSGILEGMPWGREQLLTFWCESQSHGGSTNFLSVLFVHKISQKLLAGFNEIKGKCVPKIKY